MPSEEALLPTAALAELAEFLKRDKIEKFILFHHCIIHKKNLSFQCPNPLFLKSILKIQPFRKFYIFFEQIKI